MKAQYRIVQVTDFFVLISDQDNGRSVTNDAAQVISALTSEVEGLESKKVIYRDTSGRFDELSHKCGVFTGFAPCSDHQQGFFAEILASLESSTE